jgi:alpha-tubulin suppressor-like RCC1 family protein
MAQEILKLFNSNDSRSTISCGYGFYVYVCKNGIFSCGNNKCGQLGNGSIIDYPVYPQPISFFKNSSEILSISCGAEFSVCVCKNGIFSWGSNNVGQLGIGNWSNQHSPQPILFFKDPEDILSFCCGAEFSICICKNGVFSWGSGAYGKLGLGHCAEQSSPQQILFFQNPEYIISLCCGSNFSICICKNGVFSWGLNLYGQLGIGNNIAQSSPQHISFFKNPEEIIALSCGSSHCICLCKNGIFSWGRNYCGQLGIDNFNNQFSPQPILFFKNPEDILSLSCGSEFSMCICKNGVFNWGKSFYGPFRIENKNARSSPQLTLFEIPIESKNAQSSPQLKLFNTPIESFYDLSFPQFSIIPLKRKKLLLILAREYMDPNEYIMGKDYLPRDLFNLLLKSI